MNGEYTRISSETCILSEELKKAHTLALCVPGLQCFQLVSKLEWLAVNPDRVMDIYTDSENRRIAAYTARSIELAVRQLHRAALTELPDIAAFLPNHIVWNAEDLELVFALAACLRLVEAVAPKLLCSQINIQPLIQSEKIFIGFESI